MNHELWFVMAGSEVPVGINETFIPAETSNTWSFVEARSRCWLRVEGESARRFAQATADVSEILHTGWYGDSYPIIYRVL